MQRIYPATYLTGSRLVMVNSKASNLPGSIKIVTVRASRIANG